MNYQDALTEFREASAAVRLAFSAQAAAREAQIIANTNAATTSNALMAAQDRLERADNALQAARAEPPAPADIDKAKGLAPAVAQAINGAGGVVHDDLAIG